MSDIAGVFVKLNTRLRRFKQEFGMEFKQRLEDKTPVMTGEMRDGWGFEMKQSDIEIYNTAPHASFVEYGTEKMTPRAPLRRTLLEKDDIAQVAANRSKR